jgi:hypothetical protein
LRLEDIAEGVENEETRKVPDRACEKKGRYVTVEWSSMSV